MKSLLIFLLVVLTLTLPLSGCGYSEVELNEAYHRGYEDGHDEGYEDGYDGGRADVLAPEEQKRSQQEGVSYSKHCFIPTYHIPSASAVLAKGEVFEARMVIGKADGSELVTPPVAGTIVFWIWDPDYHKVVDAGRIEGNYEFSFTVEESGDHILVFKDEEGECIIWMEYSSPANLSFPAGAWRYINPFEPNPFEPNPPAIIIK